MAFDRNDPISDVIRLLRPQTVFTGAVRAAGEWALSYEPFPHVKVGLVASGECWLAVEDSEPTLLHEGDFYLLCNPGRYVMGSGPSVRPREAQPLWAASTNGELRLGTGRQHETLVYGGLFSFDDPNAPLLLDVLPQFVHLRSEEPRGQLLRHVSELLVAELNESAIGGTLVIDHLVRVLFVHLLRAHSAQADRKLGWLSALSDPRIGAALRAIHLRVEHGWSLGELSDIAGMSRSAFAASFKGKVGRAPLEYIIHWRMSIARDALRRDAISISELAFKVGYESESAFSTAFRRVVGFSPKQFRNAFR